MPFFGSQIGQILIDHMVIWPTPPSPLTDHVVYERPPADYLEIEGATGMCQGSPGNTVIVSRFCTKFFNVVKESTQNAGEICGKNIKMSLFGGFL